MYFLNLAAVPKMTSRKNWTLFMKFCILYISKKFKRKEQKNVKSKTQN